VRLFIVSATLLCATAATAAAQSRWTFSAGPEWVSTFSGNRYSARVRSEYDLMRADRPLRLRMEIGGRWEPTRTYGGTLPDGTRLGGSFQSVDLTLGFTAALTPVPHARFAPFVAIGALGRQTWTRGETAQRAPDGTVTTSSGSRTLGDIVVPLGLGLRARLWRHTFQLEMRRMEGRNAALIGANLPF